MPYGYNGKILKVNLTDKNFAVERPKEEFFRTYIGGGGMACYYLLKEQTAGMDPLGPDNILVFATSVVSGTPGPGFSRFTVAARSPLTGAFGEAEAGGWFGPELKFAGYDGIIIKGKSENPVYLWINNENVEIRDALHLWGKDTGQVEDLIREELNDQKIRIAQCGPAGERKVRYACVINELKHTNGRTGMGAVMGSKNLRAIAVRGQNKLKVYNKDKLNELIRWFNSNYMEKIAWRKKVGTPNTVEVMNKLGILPTKNFMKGEFKDAKAIGATGLEKISVGRGQCFACPVRCKQKVKVTKPFSVDPKFGGPEYETIAALGSLCEVNDVKAVAKGNELCQRYGMDTISTGCCIAFAMECYEKGILSADDFGGIELGFGNSEAMVKIIEMIGNRQGFGDILAEGVLRASQKIGNGSERFALHVKGQELPLHDPRGKAGLGLAYALSPTGADHIEAQHDTVFAVKNYNVDEAAILGILDSVDPLYIGPEKVRLYYYLQLVYSLYNLLGLCIFVSFPTGPWSLDLIRDYVSAVTGWNTSIWELLKAAERSSNLFQAFNSREGFSRKDDTLPNRFFEPIGNGALKGKKLNKDEFNKAIELYNEIMGWDADNGTPKAAKLHEMNLGWIIPMLFREEKSEIS
jgi:aldehyde:ferredoxin oxidoreductase